MEAEGGAPSVGSVGGQEQQQQQPNQLLLI